jgi:phage baseplate assembly protein W
MSTEMVVPFQLSPDGSIATTQDPNRQNGQHIKAILATSPGERVMLPGYGVPLKGTVFLPDDEIAVSQLTEEIISAMAAYEPNIIVTAVNVSDQVGDPMGSGTIDLDWSVKQLQTGNSSGTMTATVLVGGKVVG